MQTRFETVAEQRPYRAEAYEFVMRALDQTLRGLDRPRHVSGRELVEGLRRFAKHEFGPLARHVLARWGVHSTRDFGAIVFDLVEHQVLAKTDEDDIADFEDVFDFAVEFEAEYYRDHPVFTR